MLKVFKIEKNACKGGVLLEGKEVRKVLEQLVLLGKVPLGQQKELLDFLEEQLLFRKKLRMEIKPAFEISLNHVQEEKYLFRLWANDVGHLPEDGISLLLGKEKAKLGYSVTFDASSSPNSRLKNQLDLFDLFALFKCLSWLPPDQLNAARAAEALGTKRQPFVVTHEGLKIELKVVPSLSHAFPEATWVDRVDYYILGPECCATQPARLSIEISNANAAPVLDGSTAKRMQDLVQSLEKALIQAALQASQAKGPGRDF